MVLYRLLTKLLHSKTVHQLEIFNILTEERLLYSIIRDAVHNSSFAGGVGLDEEEADYDNKEGSDLYDFSKTMSA